MYSQNHHNYHEQSHQMYHPQNQPMYQPLHQHGNYGNKYSTTINTPEAFGGLPPPSYEEARFEAYRYRDVIWAILLIVHICVIVGFGVYFLVTDSGQLIGSIDQSINQSSSLLSWSMLAMLSLIVIVSMVVSCAYLVLMRRYPQELIRLSTYVSIFLLFLGFMFSLFSGSLFGALMAGLMFGLQVYWYESIKHRIPFSAMLCEIAGIILRQYPGTFFVAFLGMFAQFIWFVVWTLCSTAIYRNMYINQPNDQSINQSNNQINVTLVGLLLSLYWTSMVISYIVQATVAGVAGVWYFLVGNQSINQSNNQYNELSHPTYNSFKRAITTSLGSLSLAALILALVKTLRAIVQSIANQRYDDDSRSLLTDLAIGCASFILSLLDALIGYLNAYSITRIAIYGESFMIASDRSLTLLKHRGLDAVVNDSLVGTACSIGSLVVAGISGLLVIIFSMGIQSINQSVNPFILGGIAFMIAFALCSTALETVEATVMAIFVSLAEDPNALYQSKPDVYERLVTAITVRYPQCRLDCDTEAQRYQRQYGAFAM